MEGEPQIITLVISSRSFTTDLIVSALSLGRKTGMFGMVSPEETRMLRSKMSMSYFLASQYVLVMTYRPFKNSALAMARQRINLNFSGSLLHRFLSTFSQYIVRSISYIRSSKGSTPVPPQKAMKVPSLIYNPLPNGPSILASSPVSQLNRYQLNPPTSYILMTKHRLVVTFYLRIAAGEVSSSNLLIMLLVNARRGGDMQRVRVQSLDARGILRGHSKKCFPRYRMLGSVDRLYRSHSKLQSLTLFDNSQFSLSLHVVGTLCLSPILGTINPLSDVSRSSIQQ